MLEFPESVVLSKQIGRYLAGKTVKRVFPPSSPHKFTWYTGDPAEYDAALKGKTLQSASSFGMYTEMDFDGVFIAVHDGVILRVLPPPNPHPEKYQLLIEFDDGTLLVFTVAMYGGIYLHDGNLDNIYYLKNKNGVSPLSEAFNETYIKQLRNSVGKDLSMKAFLATEQRIPGLGNGVLQDILFQARLHPKRKMSTLTESDWSELTYCIKAVLDDMAASGGRNTEKDLFGKAGGYKVLMSKNSLQDGCPHCGGIVVKEAYMGGAVYFCPDCQRLEK